MNDLISRQEAIAAFKPYALYDSNRTNAEWVRRIEAVLEELPSAEKQGEWKLNYALPTLKPFCSVCGKDSPTKIRYDYCPHCGAKMDD